MDKEEIEYELNFVSQSKKIKSLMLMITYDCSMACSYCGVKQEKGTISEEIYKKAVDLLFNSWGKEVMLRFFGGEPLLYPDLILEIINYTERVKNKNPNKKVKYLITTNGLHLNEDLIKKLNTYNVELMISADGDFDTFNKYRPVKSKSYSIEKIFKGIELAKSYNIPFFVNMLVTPSNVDKLSENFLFLVNRGVKKFQVGYESGKFWEENKIIRLMDEFVKVNSISKRENVEFMNLNNECEPVMLSDEGIVDVDGRIYYDIAIFHELTFPELRNYVYLGDVYTLKHMQELFNPKRDIFKKLLEPYDRAWEKRELILNNIKVGLALKDLIKNYLFDDTKKTESRAFPLFLKGTVEDQEEFKKKLNLSLEPYYLHIQNNCLNNCIFCKNKDLETTTLELIELKLKNNLKYGLKKLCLIGNEPLNHPRILEILELCNKYGFNDIQVMASGMFLKDPGFVKQLRERNVASVSLPIYSNKEKIHDRVVQRKGDFSDLMVGIDNIKKTDIEVFLHTNVLKQNIDNLNELEYYVLNNITDKFCVLPIRCKASNLFYRELIPSYSEMIEKLRIHSLVGFPICIIDRIQEKRFLNSDKISDSMKVYLLDQNYVKHQKCRKCEYKLHCPGFFKEYAKIYGVEKIKPFENGKNK